MDNKIEKIVLQFACGIMEIVYLAVFVFAFWYAGQVMAGNEVPSVYKNIYMYFVQNWVDASQTGSPLFVCIIVILAVLFILTAVRFITSLRPDFTEKTLVRCLCLFSLLVAYVGGCQCMAHLTQNDGSFVYGVLLFIISTLNLLAAWTVSKNNTYE